MGSIIEARLGTCRLGVGSPEPLQGVGKTFTVNDYRSEFALSKSPAETLTGIGIDFGRFLAGGEILTACEVVSDGIATNAWYSKTAVYADLSGGTAGTTYEVTYRAQGDDGTVKEATLRVSVE